MAGAVGIASIWRRRTGRGQDLHRDRRKAIGDIAPLPKVRPTINGPICQVPHPWGTR